MNDETIRAMLTELETPSKELTKWEEDFVVSIREQFESGKKLSERQREILRKIYEEKK